VSGRDSSAAEQAVRIVSGTPEQTERIGQTLAPSLQPGDVIALSGPLGAGKTRFVIGLARGLNAAARVRSPSFTLVNEYGGRIKLAHVDLYRLEEGANAQASLGLDERLELGALVVEWGERLPHALLDPALHITFDLVSEQSRALTASAGAGRGLELLAAWTCLVRESGDKA
jgi:tRNA threonylcarbamoyladenosine biosynthesis protein TsaE